MRLVVNEPCAQTINALEQLLDFARRGEVRGVAFAAAFRGMHYVTDVAGTCAQHPTWTRGALRALDDDLAAIIRYRDPQEAR